MSAEGRLRCDHCGQVFLVSDGQQITIDHFKNCGGAGMTPTANSLIVRLCGRLETDTDIPHIPTFSAPVGGCKTCCYTTPRINLRMAITGRMAHPTRCMAHFDHHGGNYE